MKPRICFLEEILRVKMFLNGENHLYYLLLVIFYLFFFQSIFFMSHLLLLVNFIFIYLISFHPTKQGGTGRELLIDKKEKGRELIECLVPKVC